MSNKTNSPQVKNISRSSAPSSRKRDDGAFQPTRTDSNPHLPQQHRRRINFDFLDKYDLPEKYDTTYLTLLSRDPNWIHAFWEVTPQSIEEIRQKAGKEIVPGNYTLRLYDVTCVDFNGTNANQWFDVDVPSQMNNWNLNLWTDNVSYCGEIGVKLDNGQFVSLARSNPVCTPRGSFSGRTDLMWMEVKDDFDGDPFVFGGSPRGRDRQKNKRNLALDFPTGSKRRFYLTEDDIRAYYSKRFPLLKRLLKRRRNRRKLIKDSIKSKKSRHSLSFEKTSLDEARRLGLTQDPFHKNFLLGASEQRIGGGSEIAQGASSSGVQQPKQRKFFFELGTELIVYGRTEPDAEVWWGNKRINLRHDGTFGMRLALPDGKIPLDFVARSSDKMEQRSIVTAVERYKTVYNP